MAATASNVAILPIGAATSPANYSLEFNAPPIRCVKAPETSLRSSTSCELYIEHDSDVKAFTPSNEMFVDLVDSGSNFPDYQNFVNLCVGDGGTTEGGSYLCFGLADSEDHPHLALITPDI
jgi:hypothetical protein